MKRKILILSTLVAILISVCTVVIPNVYAYIHRKRDLEGATKVGHAEIVTINNPTISSRLSFSEGNKVDVEVSVDLDCNVDAVMRVKILPKFYDLADRNVILPNNLIYNFSNTEGNWIRDDSYMCFYLDKNVKNKNNVIVLNSVIVDNGNLELYQNYKIELIVEVDIIQTNSIDYDNHPWKDNAPAQWLEIVKDI